MGLSADAVISARRPRVQGKFLWIGDEKFFVKGVTYGAFRPDENGAEYTDAAQIERDFALMASAGLNTVRIPHCVPPVALLDAAQRHGLWVMAGLGAEHCMGSLLDGKMSLAKLRERTRSLVTPLAGHPALLAFVLGNEISAPLIRFHGPRRVQKILRQMFLEARKADPGALITYANYPTSEYLHLPWLDFCCFNVYLESQAAMTAYLARLQNLADDRPLVLTESGLDSVSNSERAQAQSISWQIGSAFAAGCAGAVIFSWTDEWYRGRDMAEWGFGLTHANREPKPALAAAMAAFDQAPFPADFHWPAITVVVCTYNGSRTLRDCLNGLQLLDYPDLEILIVDDGSTDATASIVKEYGFAIIQSEHLGLSAARNKGWQAARGEIIAYIDDDAWPDPHWLRYLAITFAATGATGVGGPNLEPPGDGAIADAVAHAPGGPVHVLLTDTVAEHIPGCNMAFRREALQAVSGFDPNFRTAGDDVDICWQLQAHGLKLAYSPAAVVWHRARKTIGAYWRQQSGYGRAETLLEAKWPDKYNPSGHPIWGGRVYGQGTPAPWHTGRIYGGVRVSAPFQMIYPVASNGLTSLVMLPEWALLLVGFAVLSLLGFLCPPMAWAAGACFVLGLGLSCIHAAIWASRSHLRPPQGYRNGPVPKLRFLTAFLCVLQPLARGVGRWRQAINAWRPGRRPGFTLPWGRSWTIATRDWQGAQGLLNHLDGRLKRTVSFVQPGGAFDSWSFEVRGGLLGYGRLFTAIEDLGPEMQLVRLRWRPDVSRRGRFVGLSLAVIGAVAIFTGFATAGIVLEALSVLLALRAFYEAGAVTAACEAAVRSIPRNGKAQPVPESNPSSG